MPYQAAFDNRYADSEGSRAASLASQVHDSAVRDVTYSHNHFVQPSNTTQAQNIDDAYAWDPIDRKDHPELEKQELSPETAVGTIIRARRWKEHSESKQQLDDAYRRVLDSDVAADRGNGGITLHGGVAFVNSDRQRPVHETDGYCVVVAKNGNGLVCLPFISRQQHDLQGVPDYKDADYISIRDDRKYPKHAVFAKQGPHSELWTQCMKSWKTLPETTVVRLTDPSVCEYGMLTTVQGELNEASAKYLFGQFMMRHMGDSEPVQVLDFSPTTDDAEWGKGYYYSARNAKRVQTADDSTTTTDRDTHSAEQYSPEHRPGMNPESTASDDTSTKGTASNGTAQIAQSSS